MTDKISAGKIRMTIQRVLKQTPNTADPIIIKALENMLHKSFVIAQEEAIFLEEISMPATVYQGLKKYIFEELNN